MKIEFVSYSGKYPCLCGGELVLLIDGKEIKFGDNYMNPENYQRFWCSGGRCYFDFDGIGQTEKGNWELSCGVEDLPDEFQKHMNELIDVFNKNVLHGCCGGCL